MKLRILVSIAFIIGAAIFFLYPALIIARLAIDRELRTTGQSRLVAPWFHSATGRYIRWADTYLATEYAADLHHDDVAATEWPMFGSAFFLMTAETLMDQQAIDVRDSRMQTAVEKAAEIVASPVTATWVRTKWGDSYLDRENVFYRMLLMMGLTSYERLTGDPRYRSLVSDQRRGLARELLEARWHVLDDYPGECYPNDVLWAVVAIQRAAALEGEQHDDLAHRLMVVLDGPLQATERLPAFQVDARTGSIIQNARGCGNSGILIFAAELDPTMAQRWYKAYEEQFWEANRWVAGFREWPHEVTDGFSDVDSGRVVFGIGSVASAFGIGAAKAVGRLDHAVPLTLEAVAACWPTPFGFVIPGILGYLAADSWSLGEIALLFSMTRPIYADEISPFDGSTPDVVWILATAYVSVFLFIVTAEIRCIRRSWSKRWGLGG